MSILVTLTQTCDLYAPSGREAGVETYGVTASSSGVQCRFEPHHRQIMKANNTVVVSDVRVYLPSTATVTRGYKIVINTNTYVVDELEPMYGLTGISHYEAVCRRIP